MFRIAALNESFSDENSDDDQHIRESTKEAKEAEAYSLYNKALGLQRHGQAKEAEDLLHELIDQDFLLEASDTLEEKGHEAVHPGLPLLYSIQKNLAAIATQRKDYTAAMEFYLAAVKIDNSEVTVWYKMGVTALHLEDYQLAKVVLVEGLECNPKHWPCLDHIIPILYSLDNYFECLFYISKAFELDIQYEKGHAFRNKILQEQPMLESYTQEFFKECDPELHTIHIQPEDTKEYIEAALHMRKRRQELSRPPEPVRLEFPARLKAYKWQCIGKVLIDLYDKAASSHPPISMGLKVIVPDYVDAPCQEDEPENTEQSKDKQNAHSNSPKRLDDEEKMDVDQDDKLEQNTDSSKAVSEKISDIAETADAANTSDNKEKCTDSENDKVPFTSYKPDTAAAGERMEVDLQVEDVAEDDAEAASVEEDDSLMEAVNTAHNLIDSLSPIRAPDPNQKPKPEVIPKFDLDQPEEKVSGETGPKDSSKRDSSKPAAPGIVKSSSYGFVVSDITSPECDKIDTAGSIDSKKSGSDIATDQHPATQPLIVSGTSEQIPTPKIDAISAGTTPSAKVDPISAGTTTSAKVDPISAGTTPSAKVDPISAGTTTSAKVDPISAGTTPSAKVDPISAGTTTSAKVDPISEGTTPSAKVDPISEGTTPSAKVDPISAGTTPSAKVDPISAGTTPSAKVDPISAATADIGTTLADGSTPLTQSTSSTPIITANTLSSPSSSHATSNTGPNTTPDTQYDPVNTTASSLEPIVTSGQQESVPITSTPFQQSASVNNTSMNNPIQKQDLSSDKTLAVKIATDGSGDGMATQGQGHPSIPVSQTLQSSIYPLLDIAMDIDEQEQAGRRAQKRKRISQATEEIMMYGKRRSSRVRNTGRKKEEETVNFTELLMEFLPTSLKIVQGEDGDVDKPESDADMSTKSSETSKSGGQLYSQEQVEAVAVMDDGEDVMAYLQSCQKNAGLIYLMRTYLSELAKHSNVTWPADLIEVYTMVYIRARKHMYIPSLFIQSESSEIYQEISQICLLWTELVLDKWLTTRSKSSSSPVLSPCGYNEVLEDEDIPDFYDDDILYLTMLCSNSDHLGPLWIEHCIRVYWMQARYLVLRGNLEEAFGFFDRTKEYLEYGRDEMGVKHILLPNCKMDTILNLEVVTCQYDQLEKNQSLAETQRLYENKEFDKVVNILLQTFTNSKSKMMKMFSDPSERQSQLILLQDALSKTDDHPKCLLWGEESFNETYLAYKSTSKTEEKTDWVNTMVQIMLSLQSVLENKPDVVQTLPSAKLVRFSQNLVELIDTNMGLPESATTMVIDTVLPWILLYLLIKHEDKSELEKPKDDDADDSPPSSFMLLNIAHEYLGSRGWCSKSDGALLLFIMRVMQENMQDADSPYQDEYQQAYEQCVYCLYGHPNKRAKAKHLQDHNGTGLTLEWEQAMDVFEYFKPKTVPEFDGYTSEKISAEMEVLLKRIISLVPDTSKTMGVPVESIQNYIEGSVTTLPVIPEGREITLPVIGEIFYLLADYYLKNKEALKAVKFYIQDLCLNPTRLDSWAGMALARMSQLEAKLTSTELKMDAPIYKKSIAALRCFKRAVEIDDCNGKLWIEYGTLAYTLHSHASRQLQWKKWFAMEEEMVQIAKDSKREMVQTAQDCFRMASLCESDAHDEEWLYNYMQGKCHEKMRKPLKEFLRFYFKAEDIVHEENAKYPKKIVYAYTTPHLSVEALELYYRIHAAILKVLIKQKPDSLDIDYATCIRTVTEAANLPFVSRKENGNEGKSEQESASSADESSSSTPSSFGKKGSSNRQGDHKDHTYFRQKSTPSTPAQSSELTPSIVIGGSDGEKEELLQSSSSLTTSDQPMKDAITTVVKTLELFSEDQKSQEDIKFTSCPKLATLNNEKEGEVNNQTEPAKTDSGGNESEKASCTVGSPAACDKPAEDKKEVEKGITSAIDVDLEVDKDVKKDTSSKEDIEMKVDDATNVNKEAVEDVESDKPATEQSGVDKEMETSQCKEERSGEGEKDNKTKDMDTNEDTMEGQQESKTEEIVEVLMKKPPEELHRYLIDRCRVALEICLQRFPTHYKSHYRLAHLYMHSPYHKDLSKAKDILFGIHKWQQHPHMPCQGLFYERKPTKFFQGIWKIPIDEIDRSGSFPSHLNRCISLALHVLKELRDSSTLHQVHLQLNRQPEPGKKYLRDAEKKYYALMSHRFTLEAVEAQIEDMRKTAEMDVRLKFLLTMYKIWEHGVHKLNKFVDRTNQLLAQAYRVVTRKLETLPQSMLLDQAVRFCKHQIAQKHAAKIAEKKADSGDGKTASVASKEHFTDTMGIPRLMNLANINKRPPNYSMVKADQAKQAGMIPADSHKDNVGEGTSKDPEVIEISDSSAEPSSPMKGRPVDPEPDNNDTEPKKSTVKIKMGLLQAVKRLKPSPGESDSPRTNADKDSPPDIPEESEADMEAAADIEAEDENGSVMDIDESSSSSSASSSSSSSSSSSGSSGESADNEQENNTTADDEGEKSVQSEASSDSDDDDDDDDDSDSSESDSDDDRTPAPAKVVKPKPKLKLKPKPPPDDEDIVDSSDSEAEIDLVSSDGGDKDDDKDEDYKASDDEMDEDVILIPEEFSQRGRAIIPSPPHKNKLGGIDTNTTEVLVASVPDIDPLISSLMSTEDVPSPGVPSPRIPSPRIPSPAPGDGILGDRTPGSGSVLKKPSMESPKTMLQGKETQQPKSELQKKSGLGIKQPVGTDTLKAMLGKGVQKPKTEAQKQSGSSNIKKLGMESLKAMLQEGIIKPKTLTPRQTDSGNQKPVENKTLKSVLSQGPQKSPVSVNKPGSTSPATGVKPTSSSSGNETAIMIIDSDDE